MKKLFSIFFLCFMIASFTGISQVNIDSNGNTTIKYGTFAQGVDAVLYFGNADHYIKSVFGYGLKIGTAGAPDVIRIKQYDQTVGINRDPDSQYKLDVNGNIRVNTTVYTSDKRLKTDVSNLSATLDKIKQMQGISYRLLGDDLQPLNSAQIGVNKQFGLIAQDLRRLYPELVYEDSKGFLSVDYVSIIPVLIEAIKEQQNQIEDLKKKVDSLINK
jgi:hypothetical protein